MKVYTNYVQRYDEGALSILTELKKKPKFVDFCKVIYFHFLFLKKEIIDIFEKKAEKNYESSIGDIEMVIKTPTHFISLLTSFNFFFYPALSTNKLLILPIQRLPRYTLLLKELLRYTPEDHKDFLPLLEAFNKMKDVAVYVNEVIFKNYFL